jgi:hypothetical protein
MFIFTGKLNKTNVGNICFQKSPSHQGFEKRSSKYAKKKKNNQALMHHLDLLKIHAFIIIVVSCNKLPFMGAH